MKATALYCVMMVAVIALLAGMSAVISVSILFEAVSSSSSSWLVVFDWSCPVAWAVIGIPVSVIMACDAAISVEVEKEARMRAFRDRAR